MKDLEALFTEQGGYFATRPDVLSQKLDKIQVYIFDWDGVFNDGRKSASSSSDFSESVSMGINMLRFSTYLKQGFNPKIYIVTGEQNPTSIHLASREYFDGVFFKIKNKVEALDHIKSMHSIQNENLGFFYDDILDLSIASVVGFRGMIKNSAAPLFAEYVKAHSLADYITSNSGGQNGLREACELVIGLNQNFEETVRQRVEFSSTYQNYLEQRSSINTSFFTVTDGSIHSVIL